MVRKVYKVMCVCVCMKKKKEKKINKWLNIKDFYSRNDVITKLSNFMDPRFFDYFIEMHEKNVPNKKINWSEIQLTF